MTIIEYKLDPQDKPESYHPKTVPNFVINGGYWQNPDNYKLIGMTLKDDLPDTVTIYTSEELVERQLAIHAKHPMIKNEPTPSHENNMEEMTEAEVREAIQSWIAIRS